MDSEPRVTGRRPACSCGSGPGRRRSRTWPSSRITASHWPSGESDNCRAGPSVWLKMRQVFRLASRFQAEITAACPMRGGTFRRVSKRSSGSHASADRPGAPSTSLRFATGESLARHRRRPTRPHGGSLSDFGLSRLVPAIVVQWTSRQFCQRPIHLSCWQPACRRRATGSHRYTCLMGSVGSSATVAPARSSIWSRSQFTTAYQSRTTENNPWSALQME